MTDESPDPLRDRYDAEVRDTFAERVPASWTASQDGPLTRCLTGHGGFVMASTALTAEADLPGLVARTVAFFADHDRSFEWKTYDHDRPDLAPTLLAAGFVAEEHESLVLGPVHLLAGPPVLPDDLRLRRVTARADLDRVAAMETEVWGEDWSWLADDLESRLEDPAEPAIVFVVEDAEQVVSAAWLTPLSGTRVAGLWGGSTLPDYRRRGLYRALVAERARQAQQIGYELLQVDASEDSRPILERLGLRTVGGTTPYRWNPAGQAGED